MLLAALQSPCASVRETALRVRACSSRGLHSIPRGSVQGLELQGGHLRVPLSLMGGISHLHRCVLEAERGSHRVWAGAILGGRTAEQLSCYIAASFFFTLEDFT